MATEIRVIDSNALFDDINRFLELLKVNPDDYRLVKVDEYEQERPESEEITMTMKDESFIVPSTIAEQVVKVLYSNYRQQVKFIDEAGQVLLESSGLANPLKVTAFSFEDLNFHSEDLFDFYE